jgi:hypothetical protein
MLDENLINYFVQAEGDTVIFLNGHSLARTRVPFMPAQCTVRRARAAIVHQYADEMRFGTRMKRKESVDFSG